MAENTTSNRMSKETKGTKGTKETKGKKKRETKKVEWEGKTRGRRQDFWSDPGDHLFEK